MSEQITKVLNELGTAFEELKKRQDKIDAQGNNALDAETLARINAAMTNLEGVKSAMEKTETLASQIKDLEEALARKDYSGGSSATPEAMKHREAFDKFFRKGIEAGLKDLEVQASLSTSSDPDGGFLVPTEYETTIDRIASSVSVFRSMASAINISGDEYKMLMNVGGATAGWVAESLARLKPPGDEKSLVRGEHRQRQRGLGRRAQVQRNHEVVPCLEEGEQANRNHRRLDHRHQDLEQGLEAVAAVDHGGLLHVLGDRVKCVTHDERAHRQLEQGDD